MRKRAAKIISVTSVRRALDEDIKGRSQRYLFSMIVRTIFFILVIIVPSWPLKIVFGIFAVIIPAVAVLVANAGREKGPAPIRVEQHGAIERYEGPTLGEGEFLR
ncbi:DUF3099 domain-containing protein [Flaviflexus huanghaiensis]|uniref:DUF3099 domain-containing protein n=1 Tax=Flaviflexus huanghaiensis TaxID=1111473 RepID=UPI0015FCD22C|nr:DUF3099 domain-containing protein [Flaviflexus huanghaiensis]